MSDPRIATACEGCNEPLDFDISMAFQPIVDVATAPSSPTRRWCAGSTASGAQAVLDRVTDANRYAFDQALPRARVELAAKLGMHDGSLSINFMPNAVYEPGRCSD